jgi:acyl-CoA reductase-like NAD-dependent aldehyde dehydrogenase
VTTAITLPAAVSAATRAFLDRSHDLFIGGRFVPGCAGRTIDSFDPGTGTRLTSFAVADADDARRAIDAAHNAFDHNSPWRKMTASTRARLMFALADLMEEHLDELAELEALDSGKPLAVARDFDVGYSIRHLRYFAGWANKIEGATIPVDVPDMMCRTERTPVGVAALIAPWNYPLLIACWKLAPALAAGCTTILKPAELTSLSVLRMAELCIEARFLPVCSTCCRDRAACWGRPSSRTPESRRSHSPVRRGWVPTSPAGLPTASNG